MKFATLLELAAGFSLLLVTTAVHAETTAPVCDIAAIPAEYSGIDAQGKLVRLTTAGVTVPAFLRSSRSEDAARYPEVHWTSKIGTGRASSLEN
jgi:hypothetical protein